MDGDRQKVILYFCRNGMASVMPFPLLSVFLPALDPTEKGGSEKIVRFFSVQPVNGQLYDILFFKLVGRQEREGMFLGQPFFQLAEKKATQNARYSRLERIEVHPFVPNGFWRH